MSATWDTTVALVTTTSMCNYLGIPAWGAEEAQVDEVINAASQWAVYYTGRSTILQATLTEYYDGDGDDSMLTRSRPINSVTSLYVDTDRAYGSDTLLDSDDYVVYGDEGRIKTDGSLFTRGLQSIKIVYDAGYVRTAAAGYTTIPLDIQQAIRELVAYWYERGTGHRVGVRSVAVGDKSTSYESDIPKAVTSVFNRYKFTHRWIA